MSTIQYTNGTDLDWEQVIEGIEKKILRTESGENRVLIRIAEGKSFPQHYHELPDEVFVMEGIYVDAQIKEGRHFGPGSYIYYPAGTEHCAASPSGCTILVWNNKRN